jgi:flagellar basal-body rod modification protein FlgD
MSTISSDISSLLPKASDTGYTASAGVGSDGTIDASTSSVTGNRTGTGWSTGKTDMGKNDFLMLLIAQLKNQDPMNPTDNTQFMQQLTSLQQLESSNNTLKAIQDLGTEIKGSSDAQQNSATSISNSSAVSLMGKQVRVREKTVTFDGTQPQVPIYVSLGSLTSATVQIEDTKGTVVRTLTAGNKDASNSAEVDWDGKSDQGLDVDHGPYTIHIVGQETNPDLYAFVQDTVGGVRFTSTGAMLKVGGQELSVGDIMDVATATTTGSPFGNLTSDSALSLLGKTVRVAGSVISSPAQDGENIAIKINGSENGLVDSAQVGIYDAGGNLVDILPRPDANGQTSWDGKMMGGQDFAPAGRYAVVVTGVNNNPNIYPYAEGTVDSISTVSGVAAAKINGQYYPLSQILEVGSGT